MKRKRISFLTMLMLAVILLMPVSIQAAAKPGTVKLTKITAVPYNIQGTGFQSPVRSTHLLSHPLKPA